MHIYIIENFIVSWSDFLSKIAKDGQILVRFSVKIGQIVSQIFANFSQILMISTLKLILFIETIWHLLIGR